MAADVARKTRVVAFGIALCFLAVLFFVEAKTTWAAFSGQSSLGLSSTRAHSADSTQKIDIDSELGRLSDQSPILLVGVITLFAAFAVLRPQLQMHGLPAFVPFDSHDDIGHSRFVRPPPSR